MKSTAIKGLPAINVLDGDKVGEVERAYLDPVERRIVGFSINAGGGFLRSEMSLMADTVEIQALGDAALTLLSDQPQGSETVARYDALVDVNALEGRDVYTEGGVHLGHVAAATIDPHTYTLAGLELASGIFAGHLTLPVAQIVTIGPEVVVAAEGAGTIAAEPVPTGSASA